MERPGFHSWMDHLAIPPTETQLAPENPSGIAAVFFPGALACDYRGRPGESGRSKSLGRLHSLRNWQN